MSQFPKPHADQNDQQQQDRSAQDSYDCAQDGEACPGL
jgi:hypothetical protein